MKFRFQTYIDVSTSASSMQVLQFSVGGKEVLERCRHLFGAYKYFRLGRINVKMCPASTLPVDPLQLSYDPDDPQAVDPRDQMNPGLVRITNGEDIFTDISQLSDAQADGAYNAMMLDPRWSKFMLQSGFRRSAYPLYWQVGQLHQDKFPGATVNVPAHSGAGGAVPMTYWMDGTWSTSGVPGVFVGNESTPYRSDARGLFQVGHRGKLGFLPTDFFQQTFSNSLTNPSFVHNAGINNIPEVSVITCILPKAYKTLYYYRIYITEEVIFSGLRAAPFVSDTGNGYLGLDQFAYGTVNPVDPSTNVALPNPSSGWINNSGKDVIM